MSWQNISRAWNKDSLPAANNTADCCWTLQTQGHKDTSEGENKNSNLIIAWQRSSVCCAGVLRARVRPCLFIPSRLSPNIVVTQLNLQRRHKNKLLETLVYCHIRMNPDIKVHSVDNLVSIIAHSGHGSQEIYFCAQKISVVCTGGAPDVRHSAQRAGGDGDPGRPRQLRHAAAWRAARLQVDTLDMKICM